MKSQVSRPSLANSEAFRSTHWATKFSSDLMTGTSSSPNVRMPLLFGQSEPDAVGAKVVHRIPFPQKGVAKNCQWANGLREICEVHVSSMLRTEDGVDLPMPKKDEMQEP